MIQTKGQSNAVLSEHSEPRRTTNFTFHTKQNKSSEILYREAAIYQAREASVLLLQGDLTSTASKKLELRLLHAFSVSMSPVQNSYASGYAPQQDMTHTFVLATRYVYARNIMLGCSALYLRAHNPDDTFLVEASHDYAVRAIAECSRQIQKGVHQENAEGLFFASMFVAKHAFASRQYDDLVGDNTSQKQDRLPLIRWLRQFRGIKAIMDAGWNWIPKSEHLSTMLNALPAPIMKPEVRQETVFSSLLEGLERINASPITITAYEVSVANLTSALHDVRWLAAFPIAVPDRLIELLEERDPRAMTIIGSYLALLISSPECTFLKAAAKREYRVIMDHLPVGWLSRMEWARSVLGSDNVEQCGR